MKAAEAASVAPFEYVRLIFATLIGIIIFSEIPTVWTVIGSVIIIGSTLYTLKRNAAREQIN